MAELSIEDLESLSPHYTVVGVWPETRERFMSHVSAQTPRQAEEFVQFDAKEKGGELWICAVFEGTIYSVDTYATFVDPDMIPGTEY